MCKSSYQQMSVNSKKLMIFCHLKDAESNELLRLCACQRYCNNKDEYIPHNQKENCKYYE